MLHTAFICAISGRGLLYIYSPLMLEKDISHSLLNCRQIFVHGEPDFTTKPINTHLSSSHLASFVTVDNSLSPWNSFLSWLPWYHTLWCFFCLTDYSFSVSFAVSSFLISFLNFGMPHDRSFKPSSWHEGFAPPRWRGFVLQVYTGTSLGSGLHLSVELCFPLPALPNAKVTFLQSPGGREGQCHFCFTLTLRV